ncbi:type II toxin-antitoxin system Phd/YefM family antitoxin [Corynebacterium sp. sy039]|uniref:type II toxin-antitoxin system Phd/YefM family antitoxin n=1 Tax=Corynebacterium sp. sy039 TaxID=2599641 RepID=UPI0011B5C712|nr:type II toxin-antitoxin system Phd/YefM family antitoxin [Corynebacterium sp. sy039]QDZ41820.1 type II toxin-antitoxin system Phd/YefM family antitoxin [Corynebacterium sp. sy039]
MTLDIDQEAMTINLTKAREILGDIVARASHGGERTYITRNGKIAAVVVPAEQMKEIDQLLERLEDLEDTITALEFDLNRENEKTQPLSEFIRELEAEDNT